MKLCVPGKKIKRKSHKRITWDRVKHPYNAPDQFRN
jgi:hypothetical protein